MLLVRRLRFRPVFLTLLLSAASFSIRAQSGPDNDPAAAQGYVDNAFHDSSFDSINEFNGQLTVPIAVGPEFPVGPSLKLQLTLVYNSKVWDYGAPVPEDTVGEWRPIAGDPALGIGWNLTPGKVQPCGTNLQRVCFVRSDGAEIVFFPKETVGGTTYWETQDSNLYRLSRSGGAGPYTMRDGDGLTYSFTHQVTGYDDDRTNPPGYTRDYGRGRDGWYLTEIADLFGNRVEIEYWTGAASCPYQCAGGSSMDCSGSNNSWIPRYYRVQPLGEAEDLVAEVLLDFAQTRLVTGLRFKVRQGSVETWAEWNLFYDDLTYTRGFLGCSSTILKTLSRLELPADVAGLIAGQRARHEFTYWQNQGSAFDGLLKTMKLPTGAVVRYDYGHYHFYSPRRASFPTSECAPEPPPPGQMVRRSQVLTTDGESFAPPPSESSSGPCLPGFDSRLSSQIQSGVVKRTVSSSGVPTAVTNYTQYSAPSGELGGTVPIQQTMTVVLLPPDIDGRRRARVTLFYSSEPSPDDESLPGGRMGAEIWTGTYEGDPNHGGVDSNSVPTSSVCSSSSPLCVRSAVRVTQRVQELFPIRHLSRETTYYEPVTLDEPSAASYCSGCRQRSVAFSPETTIYPYQGWVENGRHYTLETHSDNLREGAVPIFVSREIETTWAPRTEPWLRNLAIRRKEKVFGLPQEAPPGTRDQLDQSFSFGATGFLDASWSFDAASRRILVECRYASPAGNVQSRVTASDVTGAYTASPTAPPCFTDINSWGGVLGTNNDAFGESVGHSRGLLTSRFWLRNLSSIGWFSERSDRHPTTGWVTASYDTAGVSTAMTYDGVGRVVSVSPSGDAPTAIAYSSPVKTTVSRTGTDGNSTWRRNVYDALGRLVREIRQMPAAFSVRVREYDAAGNTSFESEWGACGSADGDCMTVRPAGTTSSDFDPFGRVRLIQRADGSRTTVSYADGTSVHSETLKTVNVENVGSGVTATTSFRSDASGRLTKVTEPAAPVADVTTYIHDVAGKVVKVTQGVQSRTFLYDSFGFPLFEETPEAGVVDYRATYQGVPYADVGSIGNVRTRREAGGTITQSFAYDPAGRLKTHSAGGAVYVTNCWDGENASPCAAAGGTYPGGKLTQRIGANPGKPSTVTETFTYSGTGGRLSRKDFAVTNTPSGTLTAVQDWTYNSLGLTSSHTHPRVGSDSAITLNYTYGQGYPQILKVGNLQLVKSATYSPSGALAQWKAGNDVVTTIAQDSSGIPRPASVSTSGSTGGGFSSGSYLYDGAGNIKSIGSDLFTYDARSRLTSGYGKTYAYDRFGNLDPTDRVDPLTNRLLPTIATYDSRGNVVSTGGKNYSYDALSRQTKMGSERHLYDGSGERVARVTGSASKLYTIDSCRVRDTRFDPPATPVDPANPLVFPVVGLCQIPAGASSVAGNLTAITPESTGDMVLSSADESPNTSTLNYSTGRSRANNFILGLSDSGQLRLRSSQSVHAVIDVTGYFMSPLSSETWALTFREEGNRISSEYSGTSRQKDYFYLGNLLVATRTGSGNGTYLYYASDHLGSPRLVTNASKAKVEDHRYDAFGIELTPTFGNQPLKFAAMERDSASGNDYVHARYQSSSLGRFLSPDVLGGRPEDPQTWNRYAYARNNPLKYVDPDGRLAIDALDWWSYQQSSKGFSEAFSSFLANPSMGTGLTAAARFVEASADAVGVLIPGVPAVAGHLKRIANWGSNAADLVRLEKSLASESQVAQAMSGGGRIIAGAGSRAVFRDLDRIVKTYGGEAADWVKKSSSKYVARDGSVFEVHWVENLRTGKKVELKTSLLHLVKKLPPGEVR